MTQPFRTSAAFVGAALLAFLIPAPAAAQAEEERRWTLTIGGGAQVFPKYPGADSLGVFPLPIIDLRHGPPLTFEAPDEGWGFGVLDEESVFNFGPAVQFQTKRKEDDVGAPVGDVGFTVEAGGFVELFPMRNLRVRAEGRKGLGGHKGWLGDLSLDLVLRDEGTYLFSIGPRARLADDRYHDAYFSVTPAVAAATGLPAYDAGGGFHAIGVVAGATYMLGRNWGVYGYAGYDRLVGDAADSPIVRTFGSRHQYSAGLGLFYSFDVGRLFSN